MTRPRTQAADYEAALTALEARVTGDDRRAWSTWLDADEHLTVGWAMTELACDLVVDLVFATGRTPEDVLAKYRRLLRGGPRN